MMRQGRACLLLWGRRYSDGDADYPAVISLYKLVLITMHLGDIGREAGDTLAGTDRTWPCVKVISATLSCVGGHRAAV